MLARAVEVEQKVAIKVRRPSAARGVEGRGEASRLTATTGRSEPKRAAHVLACTVRLNGLRKPGPELSAMRKVARGTSTC